MTFPHHTTVTGAQPGRAADPVVAALGGLGSAVDCTGLRSLSLEGPLVLWLVVEGELDLFAVDAAQAGHWHFLGRLEAGTLLLGPPEGPEHTLLGRPLHGCRLRRIELRELYRPDYGDQWTGQQIGQWPGHTTGQWYDQWTGQWYDHGPAGAADAMLSPLEDAFALGVGRGLRVLYQAPLETRPTTGGGGADDDILWMQISPGSVQYGAVYEGYGEDTAGALLVDAAMWQGMVDQQYRLLYALDDWIEQLERAHEDRTAAGIEAGEAARTQADQTLLASIDRRGRGSRRGASDDATFAVCRLVAREAGITVSEPVGVGAGASGRTHPIERIAVASRIRTRTVRLAGRWWRENSGPLVGGREEDGTPVALLWRRGGYEAVDPATGARERIGKANEAAYEPRAVMLYRPLPDGKLGLLRLVRFSMRGTGEELRSLILGGLIAVGLGALVPTATGRVLGEYVPNAENSLIVQTALALIATSVVSAAFTLLQNISILRMEGRIEATLQPAVWDRLLRLPTKFFTGRSTGELAGAAMGISAIRRVLSGIGSVSVQASAVGTMNLVLMLLYSVPLAMAAIAMLLVIAAVFLGLGLWQLRYQRQLIKLGHKLNNQAFQTLRGLPKLRVAAAESFAYAAWAREFARTRELQQRIGRIKNVSTVLNAVYLPLCTLAMFMLLAGPARGSMSAGEFLTFSTAVTMMLSSVTQLTGALISAAAVQPMFEQIKPLLQETPEVRGSSTQPGVLSGAIEVKNLSYRYTDGGLLVLDGVSFQVRPGEFVAIVGASGCGKSTLLRLLIGFDEPLSGSVLYDGQDLAALDQTAVRRQCGVVLQNAQPFSGSILDCICGAEAFSLEEAWEAAAMAGLAEDIKAMPMGMHTMLSDGGGTVSGGQRQRLMIAQALIRKPRILFLDEATSALDNEAQRVVIESTRALRSTRVVIAHRLSTVMDADRVIVMSDGGIVQQGPPAELLADTDGLFHELVRRQIR
ncbi:MULTISPECIES: NHLP bacteriocin export ABC transporter permease/ATPase subunit [unclassified Streptomyces]|uniref:NHLP bacteriocin export ABC transporter permease/ATPase subunit n=1 Tax=unclassified Streptomyces TaxID=2593676 RepID=UPI001BEC88B7|nr:MULTISPECIES: NHLP bacteriocin export ABC transporter permease/ATPase subunit [unclassified Streptomyces]MBT2406464.1 NHLP bacteriocin export ABC transporter permease/ATPase subunit [Streptomyces sp. ISL-21]MBT2455593.1 NHLP bacteriocin export ABC transporter permease/ATPase subunit [Streptomyces sp. ISL-86]MBT2612462.1 NHLP bacteriocin export ABC transporter permease/ATPase subunit [Streptomyces sp. ISL-87]